MQLTTNQTLTPMPRDVDGAIARTLQTLDDELVALASTPPFHDDVRLIIDEYAGLRAAWRELRPRYDAAMAAIARLKDQRDQAEQALARARAVE
jgi:hypothetical protein